MFTVAVAVLPQAEHGNVSRRFVRSCKSTIALPKSGGCWISEVLSSVLVLPESLSFFPLELLVVVEGDCDCYWVLCFAGRALSSLELCPFLTYLFQPFFLWLHRRIWRHSVKGPRITHEWVFQVFQADSDVNWFITGSSKVSLTN